MAKKCIIFSLIVIGLLFGLYFILQNDTTNDNIVIPEEIVFEEYAIPEAIANTFYCEEGNCSLIITDETKIIYLYYISELQEFSVSEEIDDQTISWLYKVNEQTVLYQEYLADELQTEELLIINDYNTQEELLDYFQEEYLAIYFEESS